MRTAANRLFIAIAAALCMSVGALGQCRANDPVDGSKGTPRDDISRKDLDLRIDKALYDVALEGTDLFNKENDIDGCSRLYEGALRAVLPLLDNRQVLADRVKKALDTAASQKNDERSHTLRDAIDDIRSTIRPSQDNGQDSHGSSKPEKKEEKSPAKPESGPSKPPTSPNTRPLLPNNLVLPQKPLWERLGGENSVRQFVHDAVTNMADEPKLNLSRGGKYADFTKLEKSLVEYISSLSGGPLKYSGKSMKEAHSGMQITEVQFNIFRRILATSMQNQNLNIQPAASQELLAHIDATKKDIVAK